MEIISSNLLKELPNVFFTQFVFHLQTKGINFTPEMYKLELLFFEQYFHLQIKGINFTLEQYKEELPFFAHTPHILYYSPGWEFHELTKVKEWIQNEEERVPQARTGKHGTEVQVKVCGYGVDDCNIKITIYMYCKTVFFLYSIRYNPEYIHKTIFSWLTISFT